MNTQDTNKQQSAGLTKGSHEEGQAIVIGVGILCALGITFLFYLSIQRAYNLANFLDETAELAAQAAAEPFANGIVNGEVIIDDAEARAKAEATVAFAIDRYGGELSQDNINYINNNGFAYKVLNVGDSDNLCRDYNPSNTINTDCTFPIVWVELTLPYSLFGIDFTIRTDGVATLGANSREPEAVPVNLPTPTPIPTSAPVTIQVQ
ncbi:MAG: hypothetical protein AAF633_15090 [Chloroflexota bacterium]